MALVPCALWCFALAVGFGDALCMILNDEAEHAMRANQGFKPKKL